MFPFLNSVAADPAGNAYQLASRGIVATVTQIVLDKVVSSENVDMVYPDMLKEYVEVDSVKNGIHLGTHFQVQQFY